MNRQQREAAKARHASIHQSHVEKNAQRAAREAALETAIAAAKARSAAEKRGIARRDEHDPLLAMVPLGLKTPAFFELARVVEDRAPRLLDAEILRALAFVAALPAVRDVSAWAPQGKSRTTLFRSLVAHLLARYPMPAILWNAFFENDAGQFAPLVAHVAAGGSLAVFARESFPVPLTRAMCHELLATPATYGFLDAIRLVQARAAGAPRRLFEAWRKAAPARSIGTDEDEAFWFTVLAWLAKAAMLDMSQVGPICDYIRHRRGEDPAFSMKGRSVVALLRAMQSWHGALTSRERFHFVAYAASGLREADFTDMVRHEPDGSAVREQWHVREILSSRALFDEGERMEHCVYSYGWQIERGIVSIWSITMHDGRGPTGTWAMVTVEVDNAKRQVVQARGKHNRPMTTRERSVLGRWAGMNGLTLALDG
ncbi:MAG: PcfJ domain-containing protein [Byssovorax sp.]